ncbi:hypothetical protein ABIB25_003861 [Nakamurella sp. UYEF19]|uniref:DUF4389 domain-containing protein n=1 Tax=Nakamurella sp. UYEF19 TaxID=1756392 RepID=UPI003398F123
MKSGRIIALVVGCLLLLPGIGTLLGGGGLALGYAFGRNDDGYFSLTVNDLHSPTAAITARSPAVTNDLGTPVWLTDELRTDVRLRVASTDPAQKIFVGIGPAAQVDTYLRGITHDDVTSLTGGGRPVYRTTAGTGEATVPSEQTFWATKATGTGSQGLDFTATGGQWVMVLMNADGTPGITSDAAFQVKAPFLLPLALILLGFGLLVTGGAIALIVVGASGRRRDRDGDRLLPLNSTLPPGRGVTATAEHPVVLTARLDPGLSRWLWLVKLFLAFPHFLILFFLLPAFVLVTVVAGVAILFTGVYPRALFEFNRGVLRWTCRVSYYAFSGGIGTDEYPPFSLGRAPDYPVVLDIAYPVRLSRGLVLIKWWLLAIPHYLILSVAVGNWFGWSSLDGDRFALGPIGGGGVLGLLIVVAGCVLLFTGRYPTSLYNLIVGVNRWIYRVVAYSALMTDRYPPFRLDQGGTEPTNPPPWHPTAGPADPRTPEPAGSRGGP